MRKIHESDPVPVSPKSFYVLTGVGAIFAISSVIIDLVLLRNMFDVSFGLVVAPFVCNGIGFMSGVFSREVVQNNQTFSRDGCLADAFIYGNAMLFVLNIIFVFGLSFLFSAGLD